MATRKKKKCFRTHVTRSFTTSTWNNKNKNHTLSVAAKCFYNKDAYIFKKWYGRKHRLASSGVNNMLVLCSWHFCETGPVPHYLSVESHSETIVLCLILEESLCTTAK